MRSKRNQTGLELARANLHDFYWHTVIDLRSNNASKREAILQMIETNGPLKNKFILAFQCKKINELGRHSLYNDPTISGQVMLTVTARIIDICQKPINDFLILRNLYEKSLVTCRYEDAWNALDEIEKKVGFSIWGLSQKLLVAQLKGGIQANTECWVKYTDQVSQNDLLLVLLTNFKDLVDCDLNYSQYQRDLDEHIKGSSPEVLRYVDSKLKINRLINEDDISPVLQLDLQFSIVDLFVSYEKILVSKAEILFHENETEEIESILPHSNLFSSVIDIIKVLFGKAPADFDDTSKKFYEILELYTYGDYENAIKACETYLSQIPQDFQITCIYCKSLLHQRSLPTGKWISEYSKCVYSIYSMDDGIDISTNLLQKAIRQYHGIGLGIKIQSFLERKNVVPGENKLCLASFLLDKTANPNMLKQVEQSRIAALKDYFSVLCEKTVDTISGIIWGDESKIPASKDDVRNLMLHIQCNCSRQDYETAQKNIDKLYTLGVKDNIYIWERVQQITLLYYRDSDKYLEAVHLLVDLFFENSGLFQRVLNKNQFTIRYRSKDKAVIKDINHMILAYLIHPTRFNEQIIIYNNLLDSNRFGQVIECTDKLNSDEKEKWLYFLKTICSVELLMHDVRLFQKKTTAEDARYAILEKLDGEFGIPNCKEEMFEIRKLESVQNKLLAIQTGKINADIDKIYQLKHENWEDIFRRIRSVSEKGAMVVEYPNESIQLTNEEGSQSQYLPKLRTQEEQQKSILTDLIKTIVNEFISHENFGLETYLSARIRHGYCKGQLITFLQKLDLVAIYDPIGTPELSHFWESRIKQREQYETIKRLIVAFTNRIENKIEEILNEWLQIKKTNADHGMFNYLDMLSDNVIEFSLSIVKEHPDFQSLYREIVDAFWDHTERILERVRKRISDELIAFYIQSIDELVAGIPNDDSESNSANALYTELNNKCLRAKTDTNRVLHQFMDAFVHGNPGYQDFTLEELGQCVQSLFRQQLDSGIDNWTIKSDNSIFIRGQYFLPFVDVLSVLVNNVISHSGFQDRSEIKISFDLEYITKDKIAERAIDQFPELMKHDNYIHISVKNNLSHEVDEKEVDNKLKATFAKITERSSTRKLIQNEGGSGLTKMCNTIEYQISSLYYSAYFVAHHNVNIFCDICADTLMKGDRQ